MCVCVFYPTLFIEFCMVINMPVMIYLEGNFLDVNAVKSVNQKAWHQFGSTWLGLIKYRSCGQWFGGPSYSFLTRHNLCSLRMWWTCPKLPWVETLHSFLGKGGPYNAHSLVHYNNFIILFHNSYQATRLFFIINFIGCYRRDFIFKFYLFILNKRYIFNY